VPLCPESVATSGRSLFADLKSAKIEEEADTMVAEIWLAVAAIG